MATVNTLDKYVDAYAIYRKSLLETKHLEFSYRYLERGLTQQDLDKLFSLVPHNIYERVRENIERLNRSSLMPWEE